MADTPAAQPYDARNLPVLPATPDMQHAFTNLVIAVNRFPYPGDSVNAIDWALRWMRANPTAADVLLGRNQ